MKYTSNDIQIILIHLVVSAEQEGGLRSGITLYMYNKRLEQQLKEKFRNEKGETLFYWHSSILAILNLKIYIFFKFTSYKSILINFHSNKTHDILAKYLKDVTKNIFFNY